MEIQKKPLLVSVRAANRNVRPGRFETILNVGINDQTLPALIQRLGKKPAEELYLKLIRELAVKRFDVSREVFKEEKTSFRTKLQSYKNVYETHVETPFPQDVYEQMNLAIAVAEKVESRDWDDLGDATSNGVMIQEMVFGNLPGSFAGSALSHDPRNGTRALSGSAKREAQGDDALDALGLGQLMMNHPKIIDYLRTLTDEADRFLKDLGIIEFTIEKDPETGVMTPFLLQVRPAARSKEATLKSTYHFVQDGILTQSEAMKRFAPIDLEELKYEPIRRFEIPVKAKLLAKGRAAGTEDIAVGVAALNLNSVRDLRAQNIPAILVRPVITAKDDEAIRYSQGVAAFEEFGWHAQSLALESNVAAIVGIPSHFDERSRIYSIGGQPIIDRQTVLMLTPESEVYELSARPEELRDKAWRRRTVHLEPALVAALRWKIEARGEEPVFIVTYTDPAAGFKIVRHHRVSAAELKEIEQMKGRTSGSCLIGIQNVVSGGSINPSTPQAVMPLNSVAQVVEDLSAHVRDLDQFVFALWRTYDGLATRVGEIEGLMGKQFRDYSNTEEMQVKFMQMVAGRFPDAFIQAIYQGVDGAVRHELTQWIFQRFIDEQNDQILVHDMLKRVLHYGAKIHKQTRKRSVGFQIARMYSKFLKSKPDFVDSVVLEIDRKEEEADDIEFLLQDWMDFYISGNYYAKVDDSGFATYEEMANALIRWGSASSRIRSLSHQLLYQLNLRLAQLGRPGIASAFLQEAA